MSDLLEALLPVIRPLLDRPLMFFGHSMGALVAFESLRALRRSGDAARAAQLAVSACRAPHLPRRRAIHALPEGDFIRRVVDMGGMPLEMLDDSELMELLLPSLRADFELVETWQYREEPPLDLPVVAYGGAEDPFVSREALERWGQHTTAQFHAQQLPGNHFYWSSDEPALVNLLSRQAREP